MNSENDGLESTRDMVMLVEYLSTGSVFLTAWAIMKFDIGIPVVSWQSVALFYGLCAVIMAAAVASNRTQVRTGLTAQTIELITMNTTGKWDDPEHVDIDDNE